MRWMPNVLTPHRLLNCPLAATTTRYAAYVATEVPTVSSVSARRGPSRRAAATSKGRTVSRAPSSLVRTAQPNSSPAPTARGQLRPDGSGRSAR